MRLQRAEAKEAGAAIFNFTVASLVQVQSVSARFYCTRIEQLLPEVSDSRTLGILEPYLRALAAFAEPNSGKSQHQVIDVRNCPARHDPRRPAGRAVPAGLPSPGRQDRGGER